MLAITAGETSLPDLSKAENSSPSWAKLGCSATPLGLWLQLDEKWGSGQRHDTKEKIVESELATTKAKRTIRCTIQIELTGK